MPDPSIMLKSSPIGWRAALGLSALAFAGAAFAFGQPIWAAAPLVVAVMALDQALTVWRQIHR
jgi:hypothetical protein